MNLNNFLCCYFRAGVKKVCEFKVTLNGKIIFEDVVYAKVEGEKVILKNILGVLREVEKCKIVEVDVNSERLILSSI